MEFDIELPETDFVFNFSAPKKAQPETTNVFSTEDDFIFLKREGVLHRHSTVLEYFEAATTPSANNNAAIQIEAGREPYLINTEAIEFGVHPFLEVYDVMIEKQGDLIGIDTPRQTYYLAPDTLLAWR